MKIFKRILLIFTEICLFLVLSSLAGENKKVDKKIISEIMKNYEFFKNYELFKNYKVIEKFSSLTNSSQIIAGNKKKK